jgi:hypothetical protein
MRRGSWTGTLGCLHRVRDRSDGLGYLFWHAPAVSSRGYDEVIGEWHAALATDPPDGLRASWTWRLPTPPWLGGWPAVAYLDVYVVGSFADLGTLNAQSPSGSRAAAHDRAATRSAWGSGAVMACRSGTSVTDSDATVTFHDKAPGVPYPEALAALGGPDRSVWFRQMVLGVGPELLVVAPARSSPGPGPQEGPNAAIWSAGTELVASTTRS